MDVKHACRFVLFNVLLLRCYSDCHRAEFEGQITHKGFASAIAQKKQGVTLFSGGTTDVQWKLHAAKSRRTSLMEEAKRVKGESLFPLTTRSRDSPNPHSVYYIIR